MLQHPSRGLPSRIKRVPVFGSGSPASSEEPESKVLGKFAARVSIGLRVRRERRDDVQYGNYQGDMRRWDFGNEFRGEKLRMVIASALGLGEVVVPSPLFGRGRRSERSAFEFKMSKGPPKHGSDVVNRARIFQLGIKGGGRRSRGSERGSWALLSQ